MTDQSAPSQQSIPQAETKPNDKEYNFRQLEQKYQRQLEQERAARMEAEKAVQEAQQRKSLVDEDDDSEPYVDHKKLKREQAKFGQEIKQQTQTEIKQAVQQALAQERQQNWIKSNPDFYDILQHAEKLAQQDPDLAESILDMPDTFERQKLVYKNIKALGVHKPKAVESSIQQKVDANRRSPYYQPTGVAASPYSAAGDFSPSGQKNAYDQMQKLKAQLRI